MTDNTETAEEQLTVDDILDQAVEYHTILQVWREVLDASKTVRQERITPQWALRVVTSHADVHFTDMPKYRELYYASIDELSTALKAEIDTDDECLKHASSDEDAENNSIHYINVIILWQKIILTWELSWKVEDPEAPVKLAVISDVHKMFFGEVGLTSLLDQINFEFSEASQDLLRLELEELKENWTDDE